MAVERTLYVLKKRRASALYFDLASQMTFERCLDPAFLKLKTTLQSWFPLQVRS